MKVQCPVCGIEGILETRGKSQRVLHYQGFINGKRIYEKHTISGVNGNNFQGINNVNFSPYSRSVWCGCRDLNPGRQRGRLMS